MQKGCCERCFVQNGSCEIGALCYYLNTFVMLNGLWYAWFFKLWDWISTFPVSLKSLSTFHLGLCVLIVAALHFLFARPYTTIIFFLCNLHCTPFFCLGLTLHSLFLAGPCITLTFLLGLTLPSLLLSIPYTALLLFWLGLTLHSLSFGWALLYTSFFWPLWSNLDPTYAA